MSAPLPSGPARRLALLIAFGTPLTLLSGAYVAQYAFGLYPCEMCWWQRYAHFAALALAAIALAVPRQRLWLVLAALALVIAAVIGALHGGVEYGWWEGLTRCATNTGGGDPLAEVMNAPLIRCDVAPWSLFGISLAGWNLLFSGAAALAIFLLLTRADDNADG